MKTNILHKAGSRGLANHGWLVSRHTFSFGSYYNPDRVNFGALRVLNDDFVKAGAGFGTHPHDNMEIISIPLEGDLEHKDSMGNVSVIRKGDIQVMSAGTGITHSEYNKNDDRPVKFLQIWVFPRQKNVEPRYGQLSLNVGDRVNKLQQIVSPNPGDEGVWINQDAWFYMGSFAKGNSANYQVRNPENGVYLFVITGSFLVEGQKLEERDGYGMVGLQGFDLVSEAEHSEILLMEVPMKF